MNDQAQKATAKNVINGEWGLLTPMDIRRDFARAVNLLNGVIGRMREIYPHANLYVEGCGNFNLLVADSHDDNDRKRPDRVALMWGVQYSGGGGW